MKFVIVDDLDERKADFAKLLRETNHTLVGSYDSLALAWNAMADVFIIDIGSTAGELNLHLAVSVMCSFFNNRPNVVVLFVCGVGISYVRNFIKDIKSRVPGAIAYFAGSGSPVELKKAIDEHLC